MKNKSVFNFFYVVLKTINFFILLIPSIVFIIFVSNHDGDNLLASIIIGFIVEIAIFIIDPIKVVTANTRDFQRDNLGKEVPAYYEVKEINLYLMNKYLGMLYSLRGEKISVKPGNGYFYEKSFGDKPNSWFFVRPFEKMAQFLSDALF